MPQIGGKNAKKSSKTKSSKTKSSTSKRHFTVVIGTKEHGLYISSSPSSAARKAVSKLCATDKKKKVQFSVREITQGSKKKTYGPYLGYIEKLAKPIELKGRVIKYKPCAKLSGKTVKKGGMRGGGGNNNEGPKMNKIKMNKIKNRFVDEYATALFHEESVGGIMDKNEYQILKNLSRNELYDLKVQAKHLSTNLHQ